MEIIRMTNISKYFPNVVALDGVDFYLNKGEILSLLGENGAGKTTLMKILYGMISPDIGEIYYKGQKISFNRPLDAINMGIGMVH
ncbi:ATP-binding cassette domain-containing protein, partial [Tepidimicrobium xylanilyticum]